MPLYPEGHPSIGTFRAGVPGVGWQPDTEGETVDYYVTEAHVRIVRRVTRDANGDITSTTHSTGDFARDIDALTGAIAALSGQYGTGGSNVATYPQDEFAYIAPDHVGGWYVQAEVPKFPPVQGTPPE